jgi:hypothetical protein
MIENFTYGVHLVRVTTAARVHQLWAAATPREQAVTMVRKAIPEGCTATLLGTRLRPGEVAFLKMKPGEIRELKE